MSENCTVFVECIPGIENLRLSVPLTESVSSLKERIRDQLPPSILSRMSIASTGGQNINGFVTVDELYHSLTRQVSSCGAANAQKFLNLKINLCLCGGKGGFGQLLKQSAGSMNKKRGKNMKSNTKDLYKTLDGRRVRAIKRLKELESHMEGLPEKERVALQEKKEKLQKILDVDLEKHVKYDDTEFLDDVEKQVDEIRDVMGIDEESTSETDSDSESSDEDVTGDGSSSSAPATKKAKFTSFFDDVETDDVPVKLAKSEAKKCQD